ncbi:MAG: phage minor capsid protein [Oscillospiraceae bacterium]|nr:phage minor capsid protein [Oscillospiraceae bacterium]
MLHPDYLIGNLADIELLMADLHTDILKTLSRQLSDRLQTAGVVEVTSTLRRRVESAQGVGLAISDIERHLASRMNVEFAIRDSVNATVTMSQMAIRELFEDAAIKSITYDNRIFVEAGLRPIEIRQSPAMMTALEAGINKQFGTVRRLTGTTAINSAGLFERTLNVAYNKVVAGTHSYSEALSEGVDAMLSEGVRTFNYASGRSISIESAIAMNIRTGVAQTAGEITKQGIIERGATHVEVSAHMGARNIGDGHQNHEAWQGKVYFWPEMADATEDEFPDFIETTGYGSVDGLLGVNCRHSYSPFYPGVSTRRWTAEQLEAYSAKTYTETLLDGSKRELCAYEASQHLRYLERGLRHWKRRKEVQEVAGLDAEVEKKKVKAWSTRIKQFTESTGMRRQLDRERIT